MRYLGSVVLAAMAALSLALSAPASAQQKHGHGEAKAQSKDGAHHQRFDDPEKWAKQFDDPERAAWQKPDEVIQALGLKPNVKVADIGAGTGYFAIRLARAFPGGTVYAVDLEPKMVAYLGERAKSLGFANMKTLQGDAVSPKLPEKVDLLLFVNVYHHIDDRISYVKALAGSLASGGRIAIIDQSMEAPRGPPRDHRIGVETIDKEMTAAGFKRTAQHGFLPYQNFVVYEAAR